MACICYIIDKVKTFDKLNNLSDYIHCACIKNYMYWRDNEPCKTTDYIKAVKLLNHTNRNVLAETAYKDLPEE